VCCVATGFEGSYQVAARSTQCRQNACDETGHHGERQREGKDGGIKRDVSGGRSSPCAWLSEVSSDPRAGRSGEQECHATRDGREQEILTQELAQQSSRRRSDGGFERQLPAATAGHR
jgi:hypothetical protein